MALTLQKSLHNPLTVRININNPVYLTKSKEYSILWPYQLPEKNNFWKYINGTQTFRAWTVKINFLMFYIEFWPPCIEHRWKDLSITGCHLNWQLCNKRKQRTALLDLFIVWYMIHMINFHVWFFSCLKPCIFLCNSGKTCSASNTY